MPDVPPDPRAVIDARIHHLKKQSQKLNLESLEAEADLERAKQAVRRSRSAPMTGPTPRAVAAAPLMSPIPAAPATAGSAVITIRPFADGVGYALMMEDTSLWFDNEIHAINYAQDVFPNCEITVLHGDGTIRHRYSATSPEGAGSEGR